MSKPTVYDIKINNIDGEAMPLSDFKGKYILFVNVASECGYTPQYTQLQELYEQMGDKLVVIGVPCNDFGGQEPGDAIEIKTFCSTKYKVTFPMTEKVKIKGDPHPLYQFLTQKDNNGVGDFNVRWNFTKFLISPDGTLIDSFGSGVSPISEEIVNLITD